MEHCKLEISLPEEFERDLRAQADNGDRGERGWQVSGDTHDLEVWTVSADDWLHASKLSFSTRPKRLARFGGLSVHAGKAASSHSFACPRDSIQSFELFC